MSLPSRPMTIAGKTSGKVQQTQANKGGKSSGTGSVSGVGRGGGAAVGAGVQSLTWVHVGTQASRKDTLGTPCVA